MSNQLSWTSDSKGFGTPTDQDDFYKGRKSEDKHFSMTETWYWGFYEPESKLHGFVYIWAHPNMKQCKAGLFGHFGHKREQLAAELFDIQAFLTDSIFDEKGNIHTPNGLKVTFERPMEKMRIQYENKDRKFKLDMVQEAVQPAVMRSNNKHFEQTMHAVGSVVYEGKEFKFDNLSIRDRSWGEQRHEDGYLIPPYTWMNGAFSKDFAFTIAAHDDPKLNPNWKGLYDIGEDDLVKDAWIHDHGKQLKVTKVSKLTERAEDGLRPVRTTMDCVTEDGKAYRFVGEIIASNPYHCWPNAMCHCGLTKWTSPQFKNVGWGETQEVQWNDFVVKVCKPVD